MTHRDPMIDRIADTFAQDASITAIRMLILVLALAATWAWWKRSRRTAVALLLTAAVAALSFWLIQIRNPFGLGVDASMSRDWAQAGVNAADSAGGGFVIGTPSGRSLLVSLTEWGMSAETAALVPQTAVASFVLVSALIAVWAVRRRGSERFLAIALGLAGGVWPGIHALSVGLRRPGFIVGATGLALLTAAALRSRSIRRRLFPFRRRLPFLLVAAASFGSAIGGDTGQLATALLMITAAAFLASPIRVLIRNVVVRRERRMAMESLVVFAAFVGSGLFWWNPPQSVPGFHAAREETAALRGPLEWIRTNVGADEVVLASPSYSVQIAAFGQRRVLWPPPGDLQALPEPFRRARLYESVLRGGPSDRLATRFNATHLLLGPGEPTPSAASASSSSDELVRELVLVYEDAEDFRVFRLAKK